MLETFYMDGQYFVDGKSHSMETMTSLDTEMEDARAHLENTRGGFEGRKASGYVDPVDFVERHIVGEYRITKSLGKGSSSKVKLGVSSNGERVAIKIVSRKTTPKTYSKEPQDKRDERTYREVLISGLVNHPHIVRLKNFYFNEVHFFLIFEYVDGKMLLDIISSKGALSEREARRYFRQILSALEYLHNHSIVHRDLKIENILIDEKGNAKIIDFGLSNFFDERRFLNTFCGSLYFAAPELLRGIKYCGPEIDVWSLGVILYVILYGKVPFDDQNVHQLHIKIKKASLKFTKTTSKEAENLLKRMICPNVDVRYGLEDVINSEWVNRGFDPNSSCIISEKKSIKKLNENGLLFLQKAAGKQFKTLREDIIHYKRISKASLNSTFAISKPSISLYHLFIECFEDENIKIKERDYKNKKREEILHKFISNIFEKDRNKSFSRYFRPTVFIPETEEVTVEHPKVKKTFIKGLFNNMTFRTQQGHEDVRKSVTNFFNKKNIGYEIKEKSYNCRVRNASEQCSFKLSLYYNLLFGKYFLSLKKLSGNTELYRNVKIAIKSMINNFNE